MRSFPLFLFCAPRGAKKGIDEPLFSCYNRTTRLNMLNGEGAERMHRKAAAGIAIAAALLIAAGCAAAPGEDPASAGSGSAEESASSASSLQEESIVPSEEVSSLPEESSEEITEAPSSEPSFDEPSSDVSSEEPFAPWRGEDEPDLEHWQPPNIPEEGFSFAVRSLTLRPGESAVVRYEFTPVGSTSRSLVWSSSDEEVVTVEDGRVTAVSPGRATVRAQTASGRSAECSVTVVEKGTLSSLGTLAETLAEGAFDGWKFSRYDLDLDGTAELFVRRVGGDGIPVVSVYSASGERIFSVSTGNDEEWAIWRRVESGKRYLLLSYTQATASGGSRYVLDEITASGAPSRQCVFARETAPDGAVTYYIGSDVCDEQTYQKQRETYFAKNRQIPGTVLTWVTGQTAEEVDDALRATKLPTEF